MQKRLKNKKVLKHDFVLVGFTHCGTTTLDAILRQHRQIQLPVVKEPPFYLYEGRWLKAKMYERGYQWLIQRYFPRYIYNDMVVGEITPTMAWKVNVRRFVKDYGTDLKLIFLMRNPVDRLYSDFKWGKQNVIRDGKEILDEKAFHNMVKNNVPKSSDGKIKNSKYHTSIREGNYSTFLEEYYKYFPKENIKCIFFEEFIKNPRQACKELYKFLGIRDDVKINYDIRLNATVNNKGNFYAILKRFYMDYYVLFITKYIPFVSEKFSRFLLGGGFLRKIEFLYSLFDKTKWPKMKDSDRKYLENYYRADKEKLEKILERSLDDIWFK